jgi:hypothetical protein
MSTRDQVAEAWPRLGSVSAVSRELGVTRSTVQYHLRKLNLYKPVASGTKSRSIKEETAALPSKGVKRYICTSAQNNTWVNAKVWENLQALAKHYKAEILVSRFTYNQSAYHAQPSKPGTAKDTEEVWYDPALKEHFDDRRVELAPGLVWCGEMNILPTASRPLRGFETYTGRKSGIFPHVKIAMDSIASGKSEATKFNYSTGTVTQRNYIQRKAGLKAEHHHCYGALLVEVDSEGRWFTRQLNADSKGVLCDLDLRVDGGVVTSGNRVEAINWGDIHEERLDPVVRRLAWGKGGMVDVLRPKHQFMHDLLNFGRRNHHDRGNPHKTFELFVQNRESVEGEVASAAAFLGEAARPDCKTIVVDSNHDNALERWLREADYKSDPVNAMFFLRCQLKKYESIASGDGTHLFAWALQNAGAPKEVRFLKTDESFVICRDAAGGIECGNHGHLGPDGARGTPGNLSKMGRKQNTGHTHRSGIYDGMYTAGTSSDFDMGYNSGPSSWSHSHILTYGNGKRAICTMWREAWRAT